MSILEIYFQAWNDEYDGSNPDDLFLRFASINGSFDGGGGTVNLGAESSNYNITEFIQGRFRVEFDTINLVVDTNYSVNLNFSRGLTSGKN